MPNAGNHVFSRTLHLKGAIAKQCLHNQINPNLSAACNKNLGQENEWKALPLNDRRC